MIFLKSMVLRKALVIKDFPIIVNCLFGSRDRKLLLFKINEKRSVKTLPLPQEFPSIVKGIRIIYENEKYFYK
jgi:hypothetical protein